MSDKIVKDWMTKNVITVSPETTLPEADRMMVGHKIRRLPVVRDGQLMGIVTRNNLWGATYDDAAKVNIYEFNYWMSQMTVARVMTLDPITVPPGATLKQASALMLVHNISGLPVVSTTGKLIGIITESDVFRVLAQEWQDEAKEATQ